VSGGAFGRRGGISSSSSSSSSGGGGGGGGGYSLSGGTGPYQKTSGPGAIKQTGRQVRRRPKKNPVFEHVPPILDYFGFNKVRVCISIASAYGVYVCFPTKDWHRANMRKLGIEVPASTAEDEGMAVAMGLGDPQVMRLSVALQ
jgi:hypothetical protein